MTAGNSPAREPRLVGGSRKDGNAVKQGRSRDGELRHNEEKRMTTAVAVQEVKQDRSTAVLSPEERHALILAGVGPVQEKLGWPHFTKLTGAMLRKLVDAGAVVLDESDVDLFTTFRTGCDQEGMALLEEYPKFMAQGFIGNSGTGQIDIDTIVSETKLTRKEADAFERVFGSADEFWTSSTPSRSKGAEGLFARAWFD